MITPLPNPVNNMVLGADSSAGVCPHVPRMDRGFIDGWQGPFLLNKEIESPVSIAPTNPPQITCFALMHLSLQEDSLWSLCRRLTGDTGGILNHSEAWIASLIGDCSRWQIHRVLQSLVNKGWVQPMTRMSRKGTGRNSRNRYRILSHEEWTETHPGVCEVAWSMNRQREGIASGMDEEEDFTRSDVTTSQRVETHLGKSPECGDALSRVRQRTIQSAEMHYPKCGDALIQTKEQSKGQGKEAMAEVPHRRAGGVEGIGHADKENPNTHSPTIVPPENRSTLAPAKVDPEGDALAIRPEILKLAAEHAMVPQVAAATRMTPELMGMVNRETPERIREVFQWATAEGSWWAGKIVGKYAAASFTRNYRTISQQFQAERAKQSGKVMTMKKPGADYTEADGAQYDLTKRGWLN